MKTASLERALGRAVLASVALALHVGASAAPRISPLPEAERSAEQRAIAAEFAPLGMDNAVGTYLRHPKLAANILPFFRYTATASTLPARDRELVALRTAWLTRSEYLWAHHASAARKAGLTDADLKRIAVGPGAKEWNAFDATLLRTADELHVDTFVSDATWNALTKRYDVNQMIDLVYGIGDFTMHADTFNTLGVEIERGFKDRLPVGVPFTIAAQRTNIRLIGKAPRIPPLQPSEWSPELKKQLDPTGSGRPAANVFATFVRNPPVDAIRNQVPGHIRTSSTLSDRQRELLLTRDRRALPLRIRVRGASARRPPGGAHRRRRRARHHRAGQHGGDALDTALLRATDELFRERHACRSETWSGCGEGSIRCSSSTY